MGPQADNRILIPLSILVQTCIVYSLLSLRHAFVSSRTISLSPGHPLPRAPPGCHVLPSWLAPGVGTRRLQHRPTAEVPFLARLATLAADLSRWSRLTLSYRCPSGDRTMPTLCNLYTLARSAACASCPG